MPFITEADASLVKLLIEESEHNEKSVSQKYFPDGLRRLYINVSEKPDRLKGLYEIDGVVRVKNKDNTIEPETILTTLNGNINDLYFLRDFSDQAVRLEVKVRRKCGNLYQGDE